MFSSQIMVIEISNIQWVNSFNKKYWPRLHTNIEAAQQLYQLHMKFTALLILDFWKLQKTFGIKRTMNLTNGQLELSLDAITPIL